MFSFFKKKKDKNEEGSVSSSVDRKPIIGISVIDNCFKISILEKCTIRGFNRAMKEYPSVDKVKIPMRVFIKSDDNNYDLSVQDIYVIEKENISYFISKKNSEIKLSQRNKVDDKIEEIFVDIKNKDYKITKYIHDANFSTISTRWYPQNTKGMEMFSIDKKEAICSLYKLLDDMEEDGLEHILDFERIYKYFNLIPKRLYYPVISNEKLTLSWPYRFNQTNIDNEKFECLDIVLNETKEIVGYISFNYMRGGGFSYEGNISYGIKEEFRGNHYATEALNLLKQLLKKNMFEGDKDLYIATVPQNVKSQKVALNNGGELVYKGDVPEDETIRIIDGVKRVNVYRIKIVRLSMICFKNN